MFLQAIKNLFSPKKEITVYKTINGKVYTNVKDQIDLALYLLKDVEKRYNKKCKYIEMSEDNLEIIFHFGYGVRIFWYRYKEGYIDMNLVIHHDILLVRKNDETIQDQV